MFLQNPTPKSQNVILQDLTAKRTGKAYLGAIASPDFIDKVQLLSPILAGNARRIFLTTHVLFLTD
jgi:hypothetical protein